MASLSLPSLHRFDVNEATMYAEVTELARTRAVVPLGSPGSVVREERGGTSYFYRYRHLLDGRREKVYLGADEVQGILDVKDDQRVSELVQKLRRLGYTTADAPSTLVLGTLANAGVFSGGGALVGTHAYGAILNQLGYRPSPSPRTDDIDIARGRAIELASDLPSGLVGLLLETGLPFWEVPELDRKRPSTSFGVRGERLRVDLLVPSRSGPPYASVLVPELNAHAVTLPYLDYLIEVLEDSVVLGRTQVVPVRVPNPGRFAIHTLASSQLRSGTGNPKVDKDIRQAAALTAILVEEYPSSFRDAVNDAPASLREKAAPAATKAMALLARNHAAAAAELEALVR
jgi:hypothetical protein